MSHNGEHINVMVVDDTAIYRKILSDVVATLPNTKLVETAGNGQLAMEKLERKSVDLVLLDIEMPVMNGIETLHAIMEKYPDTGVVLISGINRDSANMTITALEDGALDFIPKPDGGSVESNVEILRSRLTSILEVFSTRRRISQASHSVAKHVPVAKPSSNVFSCLAIGISTGGPNALAELIPAFPANIGVPVFIVQHMPPVFTASLAESLNRKSQLKVKEAEHGEVAQDNVVYIAPGGRHMTLKKDGTKTVIKLNDDPQENSCRPAVDVLFRGVAECYGRQSLSVIMTGMGSDGAKGVEKIKAAGGYCLTQSESTCVVYGMPKAVDENRLSDEKLHLSDLAPRITNLLLRKN